MLTIGERIKFLRESKKLTQQDLSEKTNISRGNLSNYEKDRFKPASDSIIAISDFFSVSTDWLLTGRENIFVNLKWYENLNRDDQKEVEMFVDFIKFRRETRNVKNASEDYLLSVDNDLVPSTKEDPVIYLPILGDAAAGIPIEIIEMRQGEIPVSDKHGKYNAFIVRAKGDSMIRDGIANGDLVVIRPQPTVENGQIALINVNSEATIKRFYLHNQNKCELRSSNPAYPPMYYLPADVNILGQIVEIIKQK